MRNFLENIWVKLIGIVLISFTIFFSRKKIIDFFDNGIIKKWQKYEEEVQKEIYNAWGPILMGSQKDNDLVVVKVMRSLIQLRIEINNFELKNIMPFLIDHFVEWVGIVSIGFLIFFNRKKIMDFFKYILSASLFVNKFDNKIDPDFKANTRTLWGEYDGFWERSLKLGYYFVSKSKAFALHIYPEAKILAYMFSWLSIINLILLIIFVIILSLFLKKTQKTIQFLHKYLFGSLIFLGLKSHLGTSILFFKHLKWMEYSKDIILFLPEDMQIIAQSKNYKQPKKGEGIIGKDEKGIFIDQELSGYTNLRRLLVSRSDVVPYDGIDGYIDERHNNTKQFIITGDLPFFLNKNGDGILTFYSIYTNFYFLLALFLCAFFFFGVSDRFFISNSFEIEFPILILFILLSSVCLFYSSSLINIIISLEIITLASYVLIGFERRNRFSTFGSIQYFIIGSIPSGMLVLGSTFLYRMWGTFTVEELDLLYSSKGPYKKTMLNPHADIYEYSFNWKQFFPRAWIENNVLHKAVLQTEDFHDEVMAAAHQLFGKKPIFEESFLDNELLMLQNSNFSILNILGLFFILFNILFKITAAPFHFWAPSVYSKGPIASVTILSIFSKTMLFLLLFKFISIYMYHYLIILTPFFILICFLSIFFGMLGALDEKYIKRFFVFSSMGHVGYLIGALTIPNLVGASSMYHYLIIYIISSFIMWFILLHLGKKTVYITNLKRMKRNDPVLAMVLSLLMFSMSGIPPLAGFFTKLDVLYSVLSFAMFFLVLLVLICSVISFFYYLRIIKIIYFEESSSYLVRKKWRKNENRLFLILVFFLFLLFYMFLIGGPIFHLIKYYLATIF